MRQLTLVHLYPKEMNIYGDNGNVLVLKQRLQWRGLDVKVLNVGIGDELPTNADIIVGGGGQDSGQDKIQKDLQQKAETLKTMASDGVVMLMVCGMYQLFGRRFITSDGKVIEGIGVLPLETTGGSKRFIGNTVYSSEYGEIIGYENHSGVTVLDERGKHLATVVKGAGNNGLDKTEGCRINNVFGTYSHGPILAKNPKLADELLRLALERKNDPTYLESLDDSLIEVARKLAKKRPR